MRILPIQKLEIINKIQKAMQSPTNSASGGFSTKDNWRARSNAKPVVRTRSKHPEGAYTYYV